MQGKKNISAYFENISLGVVGVLLVLFPVLFLSTTTDAFVLPKQIFLIALTSLALIFLALKLIVVGKIKLRTSPFDLPVFLFIAATLASAIFSLNRFDAFIAFTPVLFVGLLYFVIVNSTRNEKNLLFLLSSLTLGAALAALITIFSFVKIYPLPFDYTHIASFTTFGSLLDQAVYFALVLPIAGYFGYNYINTQKKNAPDTLAAAAEGSTQSKSSRKSLAAFGVGFFILAIGLALTVFMLMTSQKPLILPFDTGLQTAMAAISQSTPNIFKSILLGSGFGTYLNDFTAFKAPSYNANDTLWAFTFFRSSSLLLELMATTGLLGLTSFGLIVYRVFKQKTFFLPLILAIVAAVLLPFSFTLLALLFILLALFAIVTMHNNPNKYGDAELKFVGLKKGFVKFVHVHEHESLNATERKLNRVLPTIATVLALALVIFPLYFVVRFALSDMIFQQSLVAAARNDGLTTYQLQATAITMFPYRDVYYRSFSQTNLALANALATNQPKGQKPNADVQKNILILIQQSINAGRTAVTVSPVTSFNWNNLSSIYRSLIGFGQNADKFTLLTLNQAVALDANNPQQYIDLGGVYYQLGQYDQAITQFQTAINLKKDYANAYYNIGHAYEEKGQYDLAASAYQAVKTLVASNADNTAKINADIDTLNKKKAGQAAAAQQSTAPSANAQNPAAIDVNKSQTQLPERNPKETIPAPTIANPLPSPQVTPAK